MTNYVRYLLDLFLVSFFFFFFNDTATTEIYTLSLHDALPISLLKRLELAFEFFDAFVFGLGGFWFDLDDGIFRSGLFSLDNRDRKSTRLNSSHSQNSYAVFCFKKKKKNSQRHICIVCVCRNTS